jgi:hypothetical protein
VRPYGSPTHEDQVRRHAPRDRPGSSPYVELRPHAGGGRATQIHPSSTMPWSRKACHRCNRHEQR